jgi:predicted transcriptional regulator
MDINVPVTMNTDNESRNIHFRSSEQLIERIDAIATIIDKNRTAILNEALRNHVTNVSDNDSFQQLVATEYYEDRLECDTAKQLAGTTTARRFQLLKADLNSEPFDSPPSDDVDIYVGDQRVVELINHHL